MDANGEETPPRNYIPERVKRWSMNSTRVEEIVAELMQPISDLRRNFDTDLSALLEEYLTSAGLHALDSCDGELPAGCNFAEVALLLQQSASIYGKKVDYLYQHVLDISENLHISTQEPAAPPRPCDRPPPPPGRWGAVEVEGRVEDRADRVPPPPPPVLPRARLDLLPRDLRPLDLPLSDLHGDPIGLLHDFLAARPTRDGLLVEVLELSGSRRAPPRAPSLPPAPRAASSPLPPPSPLPPLVPEDTSIPTQPPLQPAPPTVTLVEDVQIEKQVRKRKSLPHMVDIPTTLNFKLTKVMRSRLKRKSEFELPSEWREAVLHKHARRITLLRNTLKEEPLLYHESTNLENLESIVGFRGYSQECILASSVVLSQITTTTDLSDSVLQDVTCAIGSDTTVANADVTLARLKSGERESDDDGFFDMSAGDGAGPGAGEEVVGWCGAVLRALDGAGAGRGDLDGAGAGRGDLGDVLCRTASRGHHVSRVLLATLLLANSGNIEIVPPSPPAAPPRPLPPSQISLKVLTRDPARYSAAANDHFTPTTTQNRKSLQDSDYSERSDSASTESGPRCNDGGGARKRKLPPNAHAHKDRSKHRPF